MLVGEDGGSRHLAPGSHPTRKGADLGPQTALTWDGLHHLAHMETVCKGYRGSALMRRGNSPRYTPDEILQKTYRGWWSFRHCRGPAPECVPLCLQRGTGALTARVPVGYLIKLGLR